MNSIMSEMPVLISANMDQEEVGQAFENYNLVSAGVVNKDNKLVGMITADDVVTVVQEEAEEDVLRLAELVMKKLQIVSWLKPKDVLIGYAKFIHCTFSNLGNKLFRCIIEQMVALPSNANSCFNGR